MKSKKSFGIVLSALILASFLTACNKDKPADNTPAPTAQTTEAAVTVQPTTEITETAITEVPTVETTEDAAPEPVKYNEQDYKLLRDFFELTDEDGVKNGEKCFESYSADDPKTWGGQEDNFYVSWNEIGRIGAIQLGAADNGVELVGDLELTELEALDSFDMGDSNVDSIRLTNTKNIYRIRTHAKDETLIEALYIERLHVSSKTHIYCKLSDSFDATMAHRFSVEIKVDGGGRAAVFAYNGEPCYIVGINAFPDEGHKFIGWFDKDGKLVSTEADYDLTSYADPADPDSFFGCEGEFIYTAKFE